MVSDGDPRPGDIRWLSVDDLVELNEVLILQTTPSEPVGVLDRGLLESAQQRPAQYRHYTQENDLLLLGAVLFVALIQNHPFCNANKRTAFAACRLLLLLNGARFDPPRRETVEVAREVALGNYGIEQVASWVSWYSRPIDCAEFLSPIADAVEAAARWSDPED